MKLKPKWGGKSIDAAFELVKLDIVGDDFDEPTITPDSTPTPKPDSNIPTPAPESTTTPSPGSTPTPSPKPIDVNGHEYIDLGLPSGTMWATCNVGATKPEDEGLLFQFGRVDGYAYGDSNNQFRTEAQNEQDTGNSYIPLTTSGQTYNAGETLNLEDDAAHVNMGGAWRMPTKDKLEELLNNTTHDVSFINGIKGMLFTSKINRHQLFIPFAGYWDCGSFYSVGSSVFIWSSLVYDGNNYSELVYNLTCYNYNGNVIVDNYYLGRKAAFSVRGVFNK